MASENKEQSNTGKEDTQLKKWHAPKLYQEDTSATQGGAPAGPNENAFYHT
tara:strand:- start:656 stop:808 length:153 start_codon:yes stop_codon:yes gene_type:complete